ncbi:HCLS1-associated protein X-1 isoform X2 [Microcaecilia unicolor]|uniref:HCLS1-associated protein X-1 isoform X2 n=1 Tax=Microcaecilia unicolor TaxID=1415580 RepID=A0A6P7WS78_9AMPH|nr:HCLS1-associated protein X-1 isoform X2 [Microcaecilia unicolor]
MSVYDLFRGFIGFPRRRDPFFGGIFHSDEEDDDEEDEDESSAYTSDSRSLQDFPFGFSLGPGRHRLHDSFGFEEFFRDFNELFTELPNIESPPSAADPSRDKKRDQLIRDSMLKFPDSHLLPAEDKASISQVEPQEPVQRSPRWDPFSRFENTWKIFPHIRHDDMKEDKDLDSQVSSQGLDDALRLEDPQPRSYFKSISVTKMIGADGSIEEHRTVQDSQGNKETVVTCRKGDQALISTSTRNQEGKEEHTEKMINMDDRDLAQFTDEWKQKRRDDAVDLRDDVSILDRFFQRWFSKR